MYAGFYVHLNVIEINDYNPSGLDQIKKDGYLLKGISFIQNSNELFQRIHFDFVADEQTYDGFVKGFLYPDGKFLGIFHYIKEARLPDTKYEGRYIETKDGIEIRGKEYDGNKTHGYYIRIIKEKPLYTKPIENIKRPEKQQTDSLSTVLNKEVAELLFQKAERLKKKSKKTGFDLYKQATNLHLTPDSEETIFKATSIAYSWMPTMLELFPHKANSLSAELKAVQALKTIKSVPDFEQHEKAILKHLELLTNTINHSVVGVSKTLHLFYPDHVPILDRRVLKAWSKFFGKHYKKHPTLKLAKAVPYASNRQVPLYMNYWKLILRWKENAGLKSVRELEEALYWVGGI
jgi:hypothetical protein